MVNEPIDQFKFWIIAKFKAVGNFLELYILCLFNLELTFETLMYLYT